jgi:hypothetical protein
MGGQPGIEPCTDRFACTLRLKREGPTSDIVW